MRPREAVLIALLLLLSVCGIMQVWPPFWLAGGAVLVLPVLMLHLVQEGARWQMAPAYAASALMVLALTFAFSRLLFLVVFSTLASAGLCWLLPMFRFARPTGPFPVGTRVIHLRDCSRREDAGETSSGHRDVVVQLWYPAAGRNERRATYRTRAETTLVSSYQSVLQTYARDNAEPARGERPFPVILFSPAWNGRRTQSSFLTQELASHGFVVAAVDHPFNSEPVVLADGLVVHAVREPVMENLLASKASDIQRIGGREVDKQALDCLFVLEELQRMNQEEGSCWEGRIDAARAGAIGHSIGGAVAVECWARDSRIKAAVNLDGWTLGSQSRLTDQAQRESSVPLLFVYEGGRGSPEELLQATPTNTEQEMDAWDAANVLRLIGHHGGVWLTLCDSNHVDFTDRTLFSPLKRLSGRGRLQPRQAHKTICSVALDFLSAALDGSGPSVLRQASNDAVLVRYSRERIQAPPGAETN